VCGHRAESEELPFRAAQPGELGVQGVDGLRGRLAWHRGRVLTVFAEGGGLSPSDAEEFRRNALLHLGPPDAEVQVHFGYTHWAWVDGDVRIQFKDRPQSGRCPSRIVSLDITVWPVLRRLLSDRSGGDAFASGSRFLLEDLMRDWADPEAPPVVRRALPRSIANLELGVEPTTSRTPYNRTVIRPVEISAATQTRSTLNQTLRNILTPSFSNTISATADVIRR
jgi:hypothetical protein